ncbi:3-hydroxyacyl-ACP dehydratase FabZ [Sphingomonas adhaesiva]|uniref:3-hydroxyacyl-ACP dehydratase FabZ n=1 Tax=Sphingomonas adhaesiva TaxID=28212 RepID=UPI002FF988EB
MSDAGSEGATARGSIGPFDVARVIQALPHRYPMLLVDRVEEIVLDRSIRATKAVTINEGFFQGHFPGRPIMPGVLIVEALAQAAGVLAVESLGLAGSGKLVYFMAIENAKFRKPVEPGVLLSLEVEFVQKRSSVCKFAGVAKIDGQVAAEAHFTAMIADPPKAG